MTRNRLAVAAAVILAVIVLGLFFAACAYFGSGS